MPAGIIPYPFGDCRVCNDKATGVHYGVATCEGCKGFFKRSITKADKYKCFFGGECNLSPQNRNRCKSCRWRKCVSLGMSVEAVKMGRIPKVDKERALEEHRAKHGANPPPVFRPPRKNQGPPVPQTRPTDERRPQGGFNSNEGVQGEQPPYHHGNPMGAMRHDDVRDRMEGHGDQGYERRDMGRPGPYHGRGMGDYVADQPFGHDNLPQRSMGYHPSVASLHQGTQGERSHASTTFERPHDDLPTQGGLTEGYRLPERPSDMEESDAAPVSPMGGMESSAATGRRTTPSPPRPFSRSGGVFSPDVIKELINKVIESGHGKELQATIMSKFCERFGVSPPPRLHMNPPLRGQKRPGDKDPFAQVPIKQECLTPPLPTEQTILDSPQALSCSSGPARGANPSGGFGYSAGMDPDHFTYTANHTSRLQSHPSVSTNQSVHDMSHDEVPPNQNPGRPSMGGFDDHGPDMIPGGMHAPDMPSGLGSHGNPQCPGIGGQAFSGLDHPNLPTSQTPHNSDRYDNMIEIDQSIDNSKIDPDEFNQYLIDEMKTIRGRNLPGDDVRSRIMDSVNARIDDDTNRRMTSLSSSPDDPDSTVESNRCPIAEYNQPQRSLYPQLGFSKSPKESRSSVPEFEEMLIKIKSAGSEFNCHIQGKVVLMEEEINGNYPTHPLNKLTNATRKHVQLVWNELMASIPVYNSLILGLCQEIPGFTELDNKDQAVLMEDAYFDIWMIQNACLFYNGESYMRLNCKARYSRWWMMHFLPVSLVDKIFAFCDGLNTCKLTDIQKTILCAIQLTNPDRRNLTNANTVKALHDRYLDLLVYSLEQIHGEAHGRILINIFRILPRLGPMSKEQSDVILNFKIDSPPDGCLQSVIDDDAVSDMTG